MAVVGPQRLNELVGVGQGVNVGPAEPVDPAGDYRVGGLGRDTVRLLARTKPDCDVFPGGVNRAAHRSRAISPGELLNKLALASKMAAR